MIVKYNEESMVYEAVFSRSPKVYRLDDVDEYNLTGYEDADFVRKTDNIITKEIKRSKAIGLRIAKYINSGHRDGWKMYKKIEKINKDLKKLRMKMKGLKIKNHKNITNKLDVLVRELDVVEKYSDGIN